MPQVIYRSYSRPLLAVEIAQTAKEHGVEFLRRHFHSIDPGQNLLIRDLKPALELVELRLGQGRQVRIGKPTEHKVHFANAAMPAAKEQTASAWI
jgi:hypothetical protein